MLDFDQTYFGCGNKLSGGNLKELLNKESYEFLLPDNGCIAIGDGYLYSTIDTVFPFISHIETYVQATVNHCANDLYSSGIVPSQACVSVGLSSDVTIDETRLLFNTLEKVFLDMNIICNNLHSFKSDQTSITISMSAYSKSIKSFPALDSCYDIYLSKPIGRWSKNNFYKREDKQDYSWLNQSNFTFCDFLKSGLISYATDISGFGLIGHLTPLLDKYNYFASLNLASITLPLDIIENKKTHYLGCSTKQNIDSFSTNVQNFEKISELNKDILFGGEINGPILFLIESINTHNFEENYKDKNMFKIGSMLPLQSKQKEKITIKV